MKITISSLLRRAKKTLLEKHVDKKDQTVINRYIAHLLKTEATNISFLDRANQKLYFMGFAHCFLIIILIRIIIALIKFF